MLIELIDILDDSYASDFLLNQGILEATMVMVEKNIFRTFTNKSKSCYHLGLRNGFRNRL